MIDHIWRERLTVADRLIHVGPHGSGAFRLAASLEAARRSALALAKRGFVPVQTLSKFLSMTRAFKHAKNLS